MGKGHIKQGPLVDPTLVSMLPVLDRFFEGVIMTDAEGVIVYFNQAQGRIDDLHPDDALGKTVSELYRVDEGFSPTMTCLRSGREILDLACYYRTRLGKVVNSIHNVYPLYVGDELAGSICFIRDYSIVEQTFDTVSQSKGRRALQSSGAGSLPVKTRRRDNGTRFTFQDIVGEDEELLRSVGVARLASRSPSPIMLCGETGTGKELFAQSIHNNSHRKRKRYVAVNCAAIPENLLEGILFGTTRGAFTGAADKPGLFERANGGTLFLDEINAMPVTLQAKMLRVLQDWKIRRIGSLKEIQIDLKIISSTSVEPHRAIEEGALRPDLFYRIGVVLIRIPPLRERLVDLEPLIKHFLDKCNTALKKRVPAVSGEIMALFRRHSWPGNVRELEHLIEGAMNLATGEEELCIEHLSTPMGDMLQTYGRPYGGGIQGHPPHLLSLGRKPPNAPAAKTPAPETPPRTVLKTRKGLLASRTLNEIEAIRGALRQTRGNAAGAARILKISPQLLHYKMKKYGIDRSAFKDLERL